MLRVKNIVSFRFVLSHSCLRLSSDTDTIIDDIESKIQIKKLYEALSRVLKEREKTVIVMRFGLAGTRCKTQREVASELGISRSYVSRIEKKAIQKLHKELNRTDIGI